MVVEAFFAVSPDLRLRKPRVDNRVQGGIEFGGLTLDVAPDQAGVKQ